MKYVCTKEEFLCHFFDEKDPFPLSDLDFADEYSLEYLRWQELFEHCLARMDKEPELYALLAEMYMHGKGCEKDETKARELLETGINRGSLWCMKSMANLEIDRALLDFNFERAFELLEKAAESGFLPAYVNLAWLYVKGCGTPMDRKKALELYGKAARAGSLIGKYNYALTCMGDEREQALSCMQEAAREGHAGAQCYLGKYYYDGKDGEPDYEKAYFWFRQAALSENAFALKSLGEMYENGHFVPKDVHAAEFCYKQALRLGNEYARRALARMRAPTEPNGSEDE